MALPRARDSLDECRCGCIDGLARDNIGYGYGRNVGCTPNTQIPRAKVYDDDVRTASSLPGPIHTHKAQSYIWLVRRRGQMGKVLDADALLVVGRPSSFCSALPSGPTCYYYLI